MIDQLRTFSLPTLLVIFFNTIQDDDGNFYVVSTYRASTYAHDYVLSSSSYADTATRLSQKYHLDFTPINSTTIHAPIPNNARLDLDTFLNLVYEAILPKLVDAHDLDIEMALAMFALRGSADFNRGLYAVDLKNPTELYIDNLFKLLLSTDELLSRLNLNFRELQPQYVRGEQRRNTQIRINLKWYYDHVVRYHNLNSYKTQILTDNFTNLGEVRTFPSFEERLILYRQSVVGRDLTPTEINALRSDLQFSTESLIATPEAIFNIRNQKIVSFARETFADVCVGCQHRYPTSTRTFKMPRNDRYYFEINHVIAYASNSQAVDVLDNLVKLCPACHRALTPGRAFPELQREIIQHELDSRPEVRRFVTTMIPAGQHITPEEFVFQNLK